MHLKTEMLAGQKIAETRRSSPIPYMLPEQYVTWVAILCRGSMRRHACIPSRMKCCETKLRFGSRGGAPVAEIS
jgi:hypothetical protein